MPDANEPEAPQIRVTETTGTTGASHERTRTRERFPRTRRLRAAQDFARARKRGRQVNGKLLALTYAPLVPKSPRQPKPPAPPASADNAGQGAAGEQTRDTSHVPEQASQQTQPTPDTSPAPSSLPSRIGFSVSKRVGGAVTRNLVKRRLRNATRRRLSEIASGWDIIIVARPPAAGATYNALDTEIHSLLSRARLWRARCESREERGDCV